MLVRIFHKLFSWVPKKIRPLADEFSSLTVRFQSDEPSISNIQSKIESITNKYNIDIYRCNMQQKNDITHGKIQLLSRKKDNLYAGYLELQESPLFNNISSLFSYKFITYTSLISVAITTGWILFLLLCNEISEAKWNHACMYVGLLPLLA